MCICGGLEVVAAAALVTAGAKAAKRVNIRAILRKQLVRFCCAHEGHEHKEEGKKC